MTLSCELSEKAHGALGEKLGLDAEATASGILRVADTKMGWGLCA